MTTPILSDQPKYSRLAAKAVQQMDIGTRDSFITDFTAATILSDMKEPYRGYLLNGYTPATPAK